MNEAERRWREHRGDDGFVPISEDIYADQNTALDSLNDGLRFVRPSWWEVQEARALREFSPARALLALVIVLSALGFWFGVAWLVWP